MKIEKLYAIVDRGTLDARGLFVRAFTEELRDAGVRLVQYRDKGNGPQEVLRAAQQIAEVFAGTGATLILNDRADLAALLGWGVHVGQGDLSPADARGVVGNGVVIGVSTHNDVQVRLADEIGSDTPGSQNRDPGHPDRWLEYIAVGPVFGTVTKLDAEPVIGLEGVRRARALTTKPLVAIGGLGHENARSVIDAGADSVAVISALLPRGGVSTRQRTQQLLELLQG